MSYILKQAFVELVSRIDPEPKYFITFTSKEDVSKKSARRWAASIEKSLFNNSYAVGNGYSFIWVAERHKERKGYHLHTLIGGETLKNVPYERIRNSGNRYAKGGYVRVETLVENPQGAYNYIAKYMFKGDQENIDWDLSIHEPNTYNLWKRV